MTAEEICCMPLLACWWCVRVSGRLVYRGQLRSHCRAMQVWICEHEHGSRDAAVKCAEKNLERWPSG